VRLRRRCSLCFTISLKSAAGRISHGPYFTPRVLGDKLNGMIQVSRLEHQFAAELLLGLGLGTISGRDSAVLPI
jgi:hypothetical protein